MADEDDLLKEAIAGTEAEIFGDAAGKDLPSTEGGPGDRSVEEMGEGLEGQHEAGGEDPEVEAAGEGEGGDEAATGEGDRDPKTGQFTTKTESDKAGGEKTPQAERAPDPKARVPVGELLTERKARQAAETALKAEQDGRAADKTAAQDQFRLLNERLDRMIAGTPAKQPEPKTAEADDQEEIFTNPAGFIARLEARVEQKFSARFLEADFARTAVAEGEKFNEAFKALTSQDSTDPAARATVQKIYASPTPGKALMDWHAQREAARIVGNDPAAYAEKVAKETREKLAKDPEFRKELLAAIQDEARGGNNGAPRTTTRLPKSLNSAPGGGQSNGIAAARSGGSSERDVFNDAMTG